MKLRIATWNIHKGVSALGKRPRVHGIKQALAGIAADVVCLQETKQEDEAAAREEAAAASASAPAPAARTGST